MTQKIVDAPLSLFYLIIVKLKLFWYFRTMAKRKRTVSKFLSKKFTEEIGISKKTSDRLVNNYLNLGSEILDRKLYKKLLMFAAEK